MGRTTKDSQLQIRVTEAQKRALRRRAARAGMSLSEWLLSRALPPAEQRFRELVAELATSDEPGFAFAELLDWLATLSARDFETATADVPDEPLSDYWANQLAATLEHAAAQKGALPPAWTREIPPLAEPVFGSELANLRLHLLLDAPPAFAARNLFIDTSVGGRV
jgi:uncharacterized protein (DUF1778 family)